MIILIIMFSMLGFSSYSIFLFKLYFIILYVFRNFYFVHDIFISLKLLCFAYLLVTHSSYLFIFKGHTLSSIRVVLWLFMVLCIVGEFQNFNTCIFFFLFVNLLKRRNLLEAKIGKGNKGLTFTDFLFFSEVPYLYL